MSAEMSHGKKSGVIGASIAALGVVFGDIGTSPLYAMRECFGPASHTPPAMEQANLVGAASLIIWSLILIVSAKYLFMILKLDNKGEGGILALSALIRGATRRLGGSDPKLILLLGLVGGALIYADGMLTPAITVLSAVEGLSVSAPGLANHSILITCGILCALFSIQRFGTNVVGKFFGPIMILWFLTLAALGISQIIKQPDIFLAISPISGLKFLIHESLHALPLLAAVFLAVTGGEALYADLGHFGTKPIRVAWFALVLPALILNYLGQAVLLTQDPVALRNPFILLAPEMLRLPLTLLATAAAIIASQALISGAYSLTTQAVQLGCFPRVRVLHTSEHSAGQVYVPFVNTFLAISCILLVMIFRTSASLAGAYGIAISSTMTITTILFYYASRVIWGWSLLKAILVTGVFLLIDIAFLAANSVKIMHNGWLPLLISVVIVALMLIWIRGRKLLYARISKDSLPLEVLLKDLSRGSIHRVSGTAIYMSGGALQVPTALLHNLKHNQVLHEKVLLLQVRTMDEPYVSKDQQISCEEMTEGVARVTLRFGFAETPDVPTALQLRLPESLQFNSGKATYFLGRETYGVGKNANVIDRIRMSLFAVMARNSSPATAYFQLPPGRVVELGAQLTL